MTQEQLDQIEARLNAGVQWTPEECEIDIDPDDGYVFVPECACLGRATIQLGDHYENYQGDWVFCAHARQDVRALLAEVKRLRTGITKLEHSIGCKTRFITINTKTGETIKESCSCPKNEV